MIAATISRSVLEGVRSFEAPKMLHKSLSASSVLSRNGNLLFPHPMTFPRLMSSLQTSSKSAPRPYYLDYQATTPVDPRVLDAMLPFYIDMYGNPHSRTHAFGWEAEHHVEKSRKQVADLIGAQSKEIIFTSGATESNNLAIKGVAGFYGQGGKKSHMITTQIEHKCVLASCRDLQEKHNWDVTYLPVGTDGIINLEELSAAIRQETALVSIMYVNNEIGVVQPIDKIGEICRSRNVIFHTDAAQGVGKVPINVEDSNIDLLSISGHKIYGPKGIGAIYVRSKKPRIRLNAVISGGGQERGMRSGTLATPLVVGLGEACHVAAQEMKRDTRHVEELEKREWNTIINVMSRLYNGLKAKLERIIVNGSAEQRYKGNLNISFEAVEGESLLMSLNNIAISSGSACTSASLEPSYVLRAIGVGEDLAHTSLRFGFGRFTTLEEVDACIESVAENVERLRAMSPLWEVVQGESDVKPVWT